jgi:hypothetical protein
MNLFLLDAEQLLHAKSAVKPDNYANYIDALCEKLAENNSNLTQFTDVLDNFGLSDYCPQMLELDIQSLYDEIDTLKNRIKELEN